MKVTWSNPALRQLAAIHAYISADKPDAAKRVAAKIFAAVQRLERFPKLGRAGRIPGSRELIVAGLPYVVVYRVEAVEIWVSAVIHTSRSWPETF